MIVLDSNVLSELMRTEPARALAAWVQAQQAPSLCTTAVSVAEIRYGIRRTRRQAQNATTPTSSSNGNALGHRSADSTLRSRESAVPTRPALATRNTDDFTGLRLALINPWAD